MSEAESVEVYELTMPAWCNAGSNDTYCPGVVSYAASLRACNCHSESSPTQILQDVQLSHIFPDSKTFVDKPTNGTLNATLQAFAALGNNLTIEQVIRFVNTSFVRWPCPSHLSVNEEGELTSSKERVSS